MKIENVMSTLHFENGDLVKINGHRPEYMGGYDLINMVRLLAKTTAILHHQLLEVTGTVEKYTDMPCGSLRERMAEATRRAKAKLEEDIR